MSWNSDELEIEIKLHAHSSNKLTVVLIKFMGYVSFSVMTTDAKANGRIVA